MNKSKIILDLCGGTGAWSRPYSKAGYDVRIITLPNYDVCTYIPPENVYGILAAPPCTEFSLAKGNSPRDFIKGLETVEACKKIIWRCRLKGNLKFWALENPVGFLRQFEGKPYFTFQQWQFGNFGIKPTDIWGYFNKPKITVYAKPDNLAKEYGVKYISKKSISQNSPKMPEWCEHMKLSRAAKRAITPPGFAEAFFKANK